MSDENIKELEEKLEALREEFKTKDEQYKKKEKEAKKTKIAFIIVVLLVVFVAGYLIVDGMTNPGPPIVEKDEQIAVMNKLIGTKWKIDEACADLRLAEFSDAPINELFFPPQSLTNNSINCELRYERGKYMARVITSENTLLLVSGEIEIPIWYSESLDKRTKGVSIKGEKEKIFFTN